MAIDPVCKMEVNESECEFSVPYKNKTYYFCSQDCKEKFENTIKSLKQAGGGSCYGVHIEAERMD
jgi:YHS domain-containing protein